MRAVIQRVKRAEVRVSQEMYACIGEGLLVFLALGRGDTGEDVDWLAKKIINLRIFEDEHGRLNRSLLELGREILLVSQFTLYADCKKGRRPSFDSAMPPQQAEEMYRQFGDYLKSRKVRVKEGMFAARMEVESINNGPLTIYLDSKTSS